VEFKLAPSGFGGGLLLVALALSGATLPIAAPAWAIAGVGSIIAGAYAPQLIADVRKTWFEGSRAREEAVTMREDRERAAAAEAERKRQFRPGVAELFGIPDTKVRALAAHFHVRPTIAYHLTNRMGPGMVDTRNAGIEIGVTESGVGQATAPLA
jgi:hypothetical protein